MIGVDNKGGPITDRGSEVRSILHVPHDTNAGTGPSLLGSQGLSVAGTTSVGHGGHRSKVRVTEPGFLPALAPSPWQPTTSNTASRLCRIRA